MPIYLKFGSILGDVTEAGHKNWVELTSASWNGTRPVTNPSGSAAARVLAAPRLGELSASKEQDVASVALTQQLLEGEPQDATIDFVRTGTGSDDGKVFLTIELANAVLTSFSQAGGSDARPGESMSFSFTKITFSSEQMDADGSGTSPVSYAWDITANAPA